MEKLYDVHYRPKCLDLFCGAGGMSLGFEEAGFDIKYKTFDLHAESPYENFVTEHEKMFSDEGKKIKFLIAVPRNEG